MRRAIVLLLAAVLVAIVLIEPAAAARPPFRGTVSRLDERTKRLMTGRSWRRGCPVPLHDLRYLRLRHLNFDREPRMGELVVHERSAGRIVRAFRSLYRKGYPIRRMRLVDHYGANDTRSMNHDNTSAFNCRWRAGSPGVWSQHAFGRAIDVNPVENPYVVGSHVSPKAGRRFVDRRNHRRGMIHKGDEAWRAFHRIGWEWGGQWRNVRDYQHFSANGR